MTLEIVCDGARIRSDGLGSSCAEVGQHAPQYIVPQDEVVEQRRGGVQTSEDDDCCPYPVVGCTDGVCLVLGERIRGGNCKQTE